MTINLSKIRQSRYYVLIFLITFLIYGNNINNEYALDDNIVVDGIEKVKGGLKTIPKLFKSHHAEDKKQSYGYRPIVAVTFAVEKQFFGKLPEYQTSEEKQKKDKLTQANISHFINTLLYALTGIVLFNFLTLLFSEYNKLLPLIITIVFLVHPLHTEPVANIKSRDELLMFLFMLLSLMQYIKFSVNGSYKHLLFGVGLLLLAYMSKKSAIIMLGIVPVILFFIKADYKKIILTTISVVFCGLIIVLMKRSLIDESTSRYIKYFENPLLYEGSFMDRITVGLYCSWFYLKMLIFPKDLSFYYGYNQIPMANWSYYQVWLAILFYFPLGVYGFVRFLKRDVLGLGIVLWFGIMLGVVNLIFPIVGIVADRFTYVFSLGFCIVLGYLLLTLFKVDIKKNQFAVKMPRGFTVTFLLITIIYSGRTIARNPDWHDYLHLYTTDIKHLEESAKAHALISNTMYTGLIAEFKRNPNNPKVQKNIKTVIYHFKEAIRIDSTYATSLNNLGSAYLNFYRNYPEAIRYCEEAIKYDSNYVQAHFNLAYSHWVIKNYQKAAFHIVETIKSDPNYMPSYGLFNQIYAGKNDLNGAIEVLKKINVSEENSKPILMNIGNLYSLMKSDTIAVQYFEKAYNLDRTDKKLCNHLVKLFNMQGETEKAQYYLNLCNS